MERIDEIERALRDSILVALWIEYEYYTEKSSQTNSARLTFVRFEKEIIELELLDLLQTDIVDDYSGVCVSHIKAISNKEGVVLSLDPFDERISSIEKRDNFILAAKEYRLNVKLA